MNNRGVFDLIRNIVRQIPPGKVSTYGNVAQAAGIGNAQVVGWALRGNQNKDIPCHRVIQKGGTLSSGFSLNGPKEQKKRLLNDGVPFLDETRVDMDQAFFDLATLPQFSPGSVN